MQCSCIKPKQEQNTDIWNQNVCLFQFFNNTLLKYPFARNNITVSGKKLVQYFIPWSSRSFFPACKRNHNFLKDKPGKMFSNRDIFIICAHVNRTHSSHIRCLLMAVPLLLTWQSLGTNRFIISAAIFSKFIQMSSLLTPKFACNSRSH